MNAPVTTVPTPTAANQPTNAPQPGPCGLVIFGAYTIFDFNRLRRANMDMAVPIGVGIFLDVVNIFLFFLQIFGGGRR